jgi:hypothetical protein
MKLLQTKVPINNSFVAAFGFKNWEGVLLEDCTRVPKHAVAAHLMFVLIKNVHLVGIINSIH